MGDLETILFNLASNGYELSNSNVKTRKLTPEELILAITENYDEPRTWYGVPTVIKNNEIDYNKLIKMAVEKGLQNKVGYLLEQTKEIFDELNEQYNITLNNAIQEAYKQKLLIEETLRTSKEPEYTKLTLEKRSDLLKKWKIIAHLDHSEFINKYKLYNDKSRQTGPSETIL